jgi:hypothetical protein
MTNKPHPDMRDKTRITVHMTSQFAKDLNLVMASYDLSNVSFVVQQSVAAQANAIRERMTQRYAADAASETEETA